MLGSTELSRGESFQSINHQLVKEFFGALSDGRYDDAANLLAPGVKWWVLGSRGCVDPANWFGALGRLFPDGLRFELNHFTNEGSRIAVQARAQATLPDGREFDNEYHFAFEIEDGRIVAGWEYGDTLYTERLLRA